MTGGEVVFGIVRRRENLKRLAAQTPVSPIPSSIAENIWDQQKAQEKPADYLNRDLVDLNAKKKQHLSIPDRKGGKKMNRISFLGLFAGLLISGSVFFMAGFLMCYSLYPPYGGIIFQPKYAAVPAGQPLPVPAPGSLASAAPADSSIPAGTRVLQRSYADRQAMLASSGGRAQETGIAEQAEQRTMDNVKYQISNVKDQIKDNMIQGVRSITHKFGDKFAPVIGNLVNPITEDLPNQLATQQVNSAFNQIDSASVINNALSEGSSESPSSFLSPGPQGIKGESRQGGGGRGNSQKGKGIALSSASSTQAPVSSTTISAPSPSSPMEKQRLYSVRVRKFDEREAALKLAEELKRRGFEGYVVPLWNVDHGEFEVRSGGYEKFSEARDAAKVLREQGLELTTVVMTGRDEEHIKP